MELARLAGDGRHLPLGCVVKVRLHHTVFPVHLQVWAEGVWWRGEKAEKEKLRLIYWNQANLDLWSELFIFGLGNLLVESFNIELTVEPCRNVEKQINVSFLSNCEK